MKKIIELGERFAATGEPTIQVVAGVLKSGAPWTEKKAFDRATASPAYEYLRAIEPKDGYTVVLVNALGAYETYDDNRNGDGFPEAPYRVGKEATCGHPECSATRLGWVSDTETLLQHYKTFEQHAGIYKHHVNKDSKKSLGKILRAVWNNRMHRVELLLEIENRLDPLLIQRISDGEYPAVSMGCHVRWDVCSICGHRAPTRKEYCEHAKFQLRKILPNGEKVCVLNPSPRFFDISIVHRPADPTGFMLKKVAEDPAFTPSSMLGEKVDQYEAKISAVKKLSDIQKMLTGQLVARKDPDPMLQAVAEYKPFAQAHAANVEPLSSDSVKFLSKFPLKTVVASLHKAGAWLTTSELTRLYMVKAASFEPDARILDRVVSFQPTMLGLLGRYPSIQEKIGSLLEMDDADVQPAIIESLDGWVRKRASLRDYLRQTVYDPSRNVPALPAGPGAAYRASEPAKTDVLTMTDPNTGHQYQTTRGAAMAAHNTDMKHHLFGAAALSGLYLGGLHFGFGGKVPWGVALPASVAAGVATRAGLTKLFPPYRNPEYLTDQGVSVSGGTEFVKGASALGVTKTLDKMAADYSERSRSFDLETKVIREQRQTPFAAFLALPTQEEKVAALTLGLEYSADNATDPSEINLPGLALRVGQMLFAETY